MDGWPLIFNKAVFDKAIFGITFQPLFTYYGCFILKNAKVSFWYNVGNVKTKTDSIEEVLLKHQKSLDGEMTWAPTIDPRVNFVNFLLT